MKKIKEDFIFVYADNYIRLPNEGYWTLFLNINKSEAENICKEFIDKKLVKKCAYFNNEFKNGILVRFYLDAYDKKSQRLLISYFLRKVYIRKMKNVRYPNLVFLFNDAGRFSKLKLEDFIDLNTGTFIDKKIPKEIKQNV